MIFPTALLLLLLLLVSFVLAWRALPETDVPKSVYRNVAARARSLERWGTIIFLKGREIFYRQEDTA